MDPRVFISQQIHSVRSFSYSYNYITISYQLVLFYVNFYIIHTVHDPLIIGFGLYGNEDIDKVTRYTYNTGLQVHCTTSNDPSITSTDWYFANGTKVGLIDSNFREGYYPHNKTTVLQIGINRYLRLCDGGNYTCVVRTNTSRTEKRSFHLVIGSKQYR